MKWSTAFKCNLWAIDFVPKTWTTFYLNIQTSQTSLTVKTWLSGSSISALLVVSAEWVILNTWPGLYILVQDGYHTQKVYELWFIENMVHILIWIKLQKFSHMISSWRLQGLFRNTTYIHVHVEILSWIVVLVLFIL